MIIRERNSPAFSSVLPLEEGEQSVEYGLTRREFAAIKVAAGLAANEAITKAASTVLLAEKAVQIADALFDRLENGQKSEEKGDAS